MTKRIVSVVFNNTSDRMRGVSRPYAYYTNDDSIKVDDYCVVHVSENGKEVDAGGFKVVRVVSDEESVECVKKASKWIVCKVDAETYFTRIDREKRKEILAAKIEREMEDFLRKNKYKALAEQNPAVAAIIAEMDELELEE